jgi:2-hydroxy-6-oxonona-2,4-dienedioate hydrolase
MTATVFDEMCLPNAAASNAAVAALADRGARIETRAGVVLRQWGEGTPLVLLHGDQGNWTHWIRNIPALARHFAVWAVDMPPCGESVAPKPVIDFDDISDLIVAALDEALGAGTAIDLVGFSLGGRISGPVLARMEGRVKTLYFASSGGLGIANDEMPPVRTLRNVQSAAELEEVHRTNLANFMLADPNSIDDLAVFIQARGSRQTRAKISRPDMEDLPRVLRRTAARIRCISGSRDHYFGRTLETRRALFRTFQAGTDWDVIEGPGHWLMYEAADAFNAALLEFHGK